MGVNATLIPAFSLLPLLVEQVLQGSAADLAWANSAFGVGSIVGGIALGVWGGFRRRMVTAMAGLVALGAATLAVGLSPGALALAGSMAAVGIFAPMVNGPIQAALQATVAPEFQGRVFTLLGSLAGAVVPIGLLLAAPIAEILGVRAWYVAGAAACVLMGLAGFASPAVLGIDDGAVGEEAAGEDPAVTTRAEAAETA
jgi:DHA3 family macrolide efflux protein-like MFS transporter